MANTASERYSGPYARLSEAIGISEVFLFFQQQLARVAGASRPVVLIGERGTGKELAAARIHYLSPRCSGKKEILDRDIPAVRNPRRRLNSVGLGWRGSRQEVRAEA